ncbi:MAG: SUMF1/EgtB/PvdO family nonheme iron enzyme [Myxococcota bacterium]
MVFFDGRPEAAGSVVCGYALVRLWRMDLGFSPKSRRALGFLIFMSLVAALVAAFGGPQEGASTMRRLSSYSMPFACMAFCTVMGELASLGGLPILGRKWRSLRQWQLGLLGGMAVVVGLFMVLPPAPAPFVGTLGSLTWGVDNAMGVEEAAPWSLALSIMVLVIYGLLRFCLNPWLLLIETWRRLKAQHGPEPRSDDRSHDSKPMSEWRRNVRWFVATVAVGSSVVWALGWLWALADVPRRPSLVTVSAGTFSMGSPDSESLRKDDEQQHEVTLTHEFSICETEVTQAHWRATMGLASSPCNALCHTTVGEEPSCEENCEGDLPAVVSWDQSVRYLNALSQFEGLSVCYEWVNGEWEWDRSCDGYRFPTEAEWEYAARAGRERTPDLDEIGRQGWHSKNSFGRLHPVGEKEPNAWGLHDTLGNVHEWVWDWYAPHPSGSATNPTGPSDGEHRVLRGGGMDFVRLGLRLANRTAAKDPLLINAGLRCARGAHPAPAQGPSKARPAA